MCVWYFSGLRVTLRSTYDETKFGGKISDEVSSTSRMGYFNNDLALSSSTVNYFRTMGA